MGVLQSSHGVYYVRKKVPKKLEAATAQVMGFDNPRVSWLKRSLKTKDKREANIRAKPVLIEFDSILARAEAALRDIPLRSTLTDVEVQRIAAYHYAAMLAEDDEWRQDGPASEELFQSISKQLFDAHVPFTTSFKNGRPPAYGLSDREVTKASETLEAILPLAQHALARSDLSFIREELDELLNAFRLNLDRSSPAFLRLGQAVLRKHVTALQALQKRHKGEPVDTPRIDEPVQDAVPKGGTLRAALEGWRKTRPRSASTLREFEYAVRRFVELHGDLAVTEITRSKVREYREALQLIPIRRSGGLMEASLPQLVEWSKEHPDHPRISASSVNKLLAAPQALATWARDNGLIPDNLPWANPFSKMYLEQTEPERDPWEIDELRRLFASPIYTSHLRPKGGRGEAAYWLPLLGLFTGARLGELAPLSVGDVVRDEKTSVAYIRIIEDEARSRHLKTVTSRRVVPLHTELVKIGFLLLVERRRFLDGDHAPLFPLLKQGPKGGYGETWSKWFGRYIRAIGINNKASVFHSFRHGFKDALRTAGVSEDLNDALTGHSGGGVGRRYGAKEMMRRFGLERLANAVGLVHYDGLDLSHLYVREHSACSTFRASSQ